MIFATDLDNTLIHSHRRVSNTSDCVVVENKDKKPISYMSKKAYKLFETLKNDKNLTIIPVTARSTEQFDRITVTQDCPYAILASGATILDHGKPVEIWSNFVDHTCDKHVKTYEFFDQYLSQNLHHMSIGPRRVNNVVIFFKLNEDEDNHLFINELHRLATAHHWNFTLQRAKGYLAPSEISKESALSFLIDHLQDDQVITAGDGYMDIPFIRLGTVHKFIPIDTEAYEQRHACYPYTVIANSQKGTCRMLEIITDTISYL